jgi:hypothetical protein
MNTISSATQVHLDVADIASDLVVLKDGSCCLVLEVSAINFGLLSEREQDATIFAYAQLLNSLTFSIQIVIISKQKDVSDYLKLLDNRLTSIQSPLLKDQLLKYRDFVRSVVRQGNVLDKKFYISIPFSSLEMGISKSNLPFSSNPKQLPRPLPDILERATTSLSPKKDHLVRLLTRIGLRARQLTNPELLQLFFDAYNRVQLGTKVIYPVSRP